MFPLRLSARSQLKVLSAISSNFVVVWVVVMVATRDPIILTGNFIGVIVAWYIASKAEEVSEEL